MRKALIIGLGLLMACSMALAADMHGHDHGKVLNNVVSVNEKGEKTAICGCGMEFTVTDKTKSIMAGDMTAYACCDGCAEKMSSMEGEMKAAKMSELKMAVAQHDHMASNVSMKDGKKMAACPCGMEFEVGEHAAHVVENGAIIYVCGDKCLEGFSMADQAKRDAVEMKAREMSAKPK